MRNEETVLTKCGLQLSGLINTETKRKGKHGDHNNMIYIYSRIIIKKLFHNIITQKLL